jgi:hypothetical protein
VCCYQRLKYSYIKFFHLFQWYLPLWCIQQVQSTAPLEHLYFDSQNYNSKYSEKLDGVFFLWTCCHVSLRVQGNQHLLTVSVVDAVFHPINICLITTPKLYISDLAVNSPLRKPKHSGAMYRLHEIGTFTHSNVGD